MRVYEALSLGQFIALLESLGNAPVRGFNGKIHSYRGYYERNATDPTTDMLPANDLAKAYRGELGKPIMGWKGGDYTVNASELIYHAEHGDTGAAIAGLERDDDGVYEPVGIVTEYW